MSLQKTTGDSLHNARSLLGDIGLHNIDRYKQTRQGSGNVITGGYRSRAQEILGLQNPDDTTVRANYAAIITASQNRQLELDKQLLTAIDGQDHPGIMKLIKMGAKMSGEGVTPRHTKKFVQDFLGLKQS